MLVGLIISAAVLLVALVGPALGIVIDPEQVVVSVAIDAASMEIQREGIRLLKSIQLFGGSLASSRISVCVAQASGVGMPFMDDLRALNIAKLTVVDRIPGAAPTLNKLCAFESPIMEDSDYLLYLDADIFVAADPLPLIAAEPMVGKSILCGRPWNTMDAEMIRFPEFVGEIGEGSRFFDADLQESLAMEGWSFYGTCNTGVYFMRGDVAKELVASARTYLHKAQTDPSFRASNIFNAGYGGIDSIILWAAQYERGFEVSLFSPRLNWLAAAEPYYRRFVDRELSLARAHAEPVAAHGDSGPQVHERLQWEQCTPALVHFSRGSDLRFEILESGDCQVVLSAQRDNEYSHVERLAHSLTPYETCFAFFLALLEYDREPPIASWARSVVTPRFQGEPCGEREMTWCLQGCALSFISLPKVVARISSSPIVVLEIDIACTDDQHTNANVNSFTGRLVSLETIISGGGVGKRTASTVLESRGDISIEFVTNIFPPTSDGMWPPRTSPLFNNPLNVDLLVVINSTPDTPGIKFAFDLAFINN